MFAEIFKNTNKNTDKTFSNIRMFWSEILLLLFIMRLSNLSTFL